LFSGRRFAGAMSEAGAQVQSLVFFDVETTGLEAARLTELSFVAVGAADLLRSAPAAPRVRHKLSLCLNPRKVISPFASNMTGALSKLSFHPVLRPLFRSFED